jgi:hypothetical protein
MWGLHYFDSVISEITRIPVSPNSVFKKVPMVEKFYPLVDNVSREEEQLSQFPVAIIVSTSVLVP